MSIGIRSGVNWMRLKLSDIVSASRLMSSVFARPGTPMSSAWPRANRQIAQLLDDLLLADDDLPQLVGQPPVHLAQLVDRFDVVCGRGAEEGAVGIRERRGGMAG